MASSAPSAAPMPLRRAALVYGLALVASLIAVWALFSPTLGSLAVPFVYQGDALFYAMTVKSVLETGWNYANDRLGMPFGQVLADFPVPDSLSLLELRGIGALAGDWARTFNLFYLLGYPLTTVATVFALRRFGVSSWPALLASLLYSFSSYRVVRGPQHLMYANYFAVPLMGMVLLWLCAGELAVRRWSDLRRGRFIASVLICAAIASTGGVYFAFFACALLLAVALYSALQARRWQPALLPLGLVVLTFAVLVANLLPSILYRAEHGSVGTAARAFSDSEHLGLKLVQMLLPVQGHRLAAWAALRQTYDAGPRLLNQEAVVSLGVIGSIGFTCSIVRLLFGRRAGSNDATGQRLDHLGMLSGVSVLVGTMGGLGVLFSLLVSGQVRGYDRIFVFVMFFSVATVALLLDRACRAWCRSGASRAWFAAAVLVTTVLGILDQTPTQSLPFAERAAREFAHDRAFFARVEAELPSGAMVFVLPRHDFPEGEVYDGLRPYLQTRTLRFSAGAMRGRRADRWLQHVQALPLPERLDTLALAGFAAVLVDRWYVDAQGDDLVRGIETHLGPPSVTDTDGRYLLFELASKASAAPGAEAATVEARREAALHPVLIDWGAGFSAREGVPDGFWRFGQASCELTLTNDLPRPRSIELSMTVTASGKGALVLDSEPIDATITVDEVPRRSVIRLTIPPGKHVVRLRCDAPPLVLPNDGRSVVFRVSEPVLREED